MSYYDDASIMFIGGAATGVDGKAGTAKPINGGSPLYVTRGSNLTATRVGSNGLIEKGRENLLKDSNSFDPSGTAWNPTTAYTLTSGQEGYDGSNDAWLLNKLNTLNNYFEQRSINFMSGNVITESVYAKAGTEVGVLLYNPNGYAHWNLSSGTLISEGGGNLISSNIESVGNGWYRCSITVSGGIAYDRMMIKVINSSAANSSGSIYIQDAQVELGLAATEYIESGATTGKAGLLENEPRFNYPIGGSVPHLLLEPQRSNLIMQSEYFDDWTNSEETDLSVNNTTSPEGVQNAYSITPQATSNYHRINKSITIVSGNQYSFSFFAKPNGNDFILFRTTISGSNRNVCFNISNGTIDFESSAVDNAIIEDYGNGWYRCSVVWTASITSQIIYLRSQISSQVGTDDGIDTFTGNGRGAYFYGAQLEEGSYPTSYIPNHSGSSVTRESDIYQNSDIDAVTNMSTDECTVLFDIDLPQGRESSSRFLQFVDVAGGGTTLWGLKGNYIPSPIIQLHAQGTITTSSTHSLSAGRHKIAVRWLSGTATVYIDGAEVSALSVTDSAAPTSFDQVYGSGAPYRHLVHELIVFESGWDNVDLEILTGATPYKSFAAMAATLNYTVYE